MPEDARQGTTAEEGFVDPALLARVRVGRQYVAAKFGFRNHWYPALFSHEITDGDVRAVELLGEKILLRRIDGRVYGIRDRCLHRGVALSRKVECYSKDTITCWYHGFTYRFDSGELCNILGSPDSAVIGRRRIRTYPVEEAQGLVFVFVGDHTDAPPPLAEDVPPDFLEPDLQVYGVRSEVQSNWRLGCENGFDSTHIFIHKNAALIEDNDLALPLGLVPKGRGSFRTVENAGGPKGVYDLFDPDHVTPVFTGTVDEQIVLNANPEGSNKLPHHISIWLPCALCVHPWPDPSLTQFEWYVPIDGARHIYFRALGKVCSNEQERQEFRREFEQRWRSVALEPGGFNGDDIWAREATEPFYRDDTGWLREQLFEADGNIIEWRKLASRHNRGIQLPGHLS
jgi:carbazole 1,9a-dioxygenase terminal dioxygenase component